MDETLTLAPEVLAGMIAHAKRESPLECCGLLAGRGRTVQTLFPLINEAQSPTRFYCAQGLFEPFRRMRSAGLELVGVYHSHPSTPAVPSRTDLTENYYPDAVHVIVSLAGPEPVVRAYLLGVDQYREAAWKTAPTG